MDHGPEALPGQPFYSFCVSPDVKRFHGYSTAVFGGTVGAEEFQVGNFISLDARGIGAVSDVSSTIFSGAGVCSSGS